MNYQLVRKYFREDGIFGELRDESGNLLCYTLEHGYTDCKGGWIPKVPQGTYQCLRGLHQLAHMAAPFETFEIAEVPGHDHILFHAGNWDRDSEGCVLLGVAVAKSEKQDWMLIESQAAFHLFLASQEGISEFTLIVKDDEQPS